MKLRAILPILDRRLVERRTYQIKPDGLFNTLEQEYDNLQKADFDATRIAPVYHPRKKTLVYADMCVRKPGEQAALAEKLGLCLPADYLAFCRTFSEYIIAGRCPIHIWGPDGIEIDTCGLRSAWDIPMGTPYRLFYFARIIGEPGCFVFRWSKALAKIDVVIVEDYGEIGEPDLLGPDGDRYVTDSDFTSWLARMVETDCYPLIPGTRDRTRAGLKRIS